MILVPGLAAAPGWSVHLLFEMITWQVSPVSVKSYWIAASRLPAASGLKRAHMRSRKAKPSPFAPVSETSPLATAGSALAGFGA